MNRDPERIHDGYVPVHILPRPQWVIEGDGQDLDGLAAEAPQNAPAVQPGHDRTLQHRRILPWLQRGPARDLSGGQPYSGAPNRLQTHSWRPGSALSSASEPGVREAATVQDPSGASAVAGAERCPGE